MPSSPGFGFGGALNVGAGVKLGSAAVGVNKAPTVEVGFTKVVKVLHARETIKKSEKTIANRI